MRIQSRLNPRVNIRTGPAHGPYWHAYFWQDGCTRSKYIGKYIGKQLPAESAG
jgi:hypothetical protein